MGSDERLDTKRSRNLRPTRTEAIEVKRKRGGAPSFKALKAVLFAGT